jgi:hypothetical protein
MLTHDFKNYTQMFQYNNTYLMSEYYIASMNTFIAFILINNNYIKNK